MGRGFAGSHYPTFTAEFRSVFDHTAGGLDPLRLLFSLWLGTCSVADYAVEFCTIAADGQWNKVALKDVFYNGLADAVKDELVVRETGSLRKFINLVNALDNHLRERQSGTVFEGVPDLSGCSLASPVTLDEPMQLGRARLTKQERLFRDGACLYCGQPGNMIKACPHRPKERAHL